MFKLSSIFVYLLAAVYPPPPTIISPNRDKIKPFPKAILHVPQDRRLLYCYHVRSFCKPGVQNDIQSIIDT